MSESPPRGPRPSRRAAVLGGVFLVTVVAVGAHCVLQPGEPVDEARAPVVVCSDAGPGEAGVYTAVNVLDYGPPNDNSIRAAISAATTGTCANSLDFPVVYLPPATYQVSAPIDVSGVNDLTLIGSPGAILNLVPPDGGTTLIGPAVRTTGDGGVTLKLSISGLTVQANGTPFLGNADYGLLDLQDVIDFVVRDVHIVGGFDGGTTALTDGIAISGDCNGVLASGLIQGVTIDSVANVGIRLAQRANQVTVDSCEVRGTSGTVTSTPNPGSGMWIGGADNVVVTGLKSHDNSGDGLYVGLSSTCSANTPSGHIQVNGGIFQNNGAGSSTGSGIEIASRVQYAAPGDIQLNGVQTVQNHAYGILVSGGLDVAINAPNASLNGAQGILVQNPVVSGTLLWDETQRVRISGANVFNNCTSAPCAGIAINSVEHVTVAGATVSSTLPPSDAGTSYQYRGIDVMNTGGMACQAIRLSDIDVAAGGNPSYTFPVCSCPNTGDAGCNGTCTPAGSGFYRLEGSGNPDGGLAAPVGSIFVDNGSGTVYRMTSGGWVTP
jgi:hypothetical protein